MKRFLPRESLDAAIEQVMICHRYAVDEDGLRLFPATADPREIEKAICSLAQAEPQQPMRVFSAAGLFPSLDTDPLGR